MAIHKYIETVLFLYLNLLFISNCVLTFAAHMCEFLLSFLFLAALNGEIYSINILVTMC